MHHVMHVEPPAAVTSRHPAAPVTLLDEDAGAVGNGAEVPTDADGASSLLEDHPDTAVAAQEAAQARIERRPLGFGALGLRVLGSPAPCLGADVEQDQVPVAVGPALPTQGAVGHGQEGIGPVDVMRSGRGRGLVLPGVEQLVTGGDDGPPHHGALIGGQLGRQ